MQFDRSEIQSRVERLRVELRSRKLDSLLIDECEATAYYFNYDPGMSFYRAGLIPTESEAFFVLRSLDVAPLREQTWIEDIVGYLDGEHPARAIAEKIRQRGFDRARIGIDLTSHALTVQMFEALKRELPHVEFVDVDGLPRKLRKLKSKAEIEKLRKASAINDATMQEIVEAVKPGFTAREGAHMAVEALVRHGADPGRPYGTIAAATGWDFLHGHLHDTPLQQGDVLFIELSSYFQGYCSRMMRCVAVGDISPELDVLSKEIIKLQDKQIAAMKPGAIAKDVDCIMRQGAIDAGIREQYNNVTGYTLGYYSTKITRGADFTWSFLPTSEWVLEEDMIFDMYTSGRGIAISETVLVGPNGGERLTKMERRLFSSNEGGKLT
ncbi:Xaa-Pro peptidase family protein, partial [Mesorhizobium sp. M0520]|uniref:M24 family metallopeptidase n=1 Tax=Mesorhizobium sp. M0520 TaxID=2956957 RepID=UPI00333D2D71